MSSVTNVNSLAASSVPNLQGNMPTATIALPNSSNVQVLTSGESTIQSQQSTTLLKVAPSSSTAHITIPPGAVLARSHTGQLLIVNSTSIANNSSQAQQNAVDTTVSKAVTTVVSQNQVNMVSTVKVITTAAPAISTTAKTNVATTATSPQTMTQDDIVNVSKCRNFLTTLIKLASTGAQTQSTVSNVKKLVQNLIDNKIQPEYFTQQLQIELNSAPQPYLVPFLKRSLPLLRLTMLQQNSGGTANTQQPTTPQSNTVAVAQNVIRRPISKAKPLVKNNVPDIKLPRYSSSPTPQHTINDSHARYVQIQKSIHQTPHGANNRVNPKWAGTSTGGATSGGTFKDDDDINDVASMAGVNLSEESARILATNSTVIGSQMRSCNDTTILQSKALLHRIKTVVSKHPHIQKLGSDFDKYLALAAEARVKDVLEKVSLVAYHRTINFKESNHYTACQDVKSQLKFMLQLDQIERKRHEEMEREVLMRAIKSRSKNEDPEQLRLKQKAKEMQQLEMEKLQIRNADETARIAIGPRKKKPKLMSTATSSANGETDYAPYLSTTTRQSMLKPRLKRVNLRDLLFVLESEKELCKSNVLYSSYLK